ncbi:peptidylprolyl isomerase [Flavobacteriaceae bacterium F08102]|nr:peptidylprolyl isomerase [Flavobacteriaceae bacterium F08102]
MNNLKRFFFVLLCAASINLFSQADDATLFTVDGDIITVGEFMKVFNKNRDIVAKENKKSIAEYLDLYINYKLKLKEAYRLKYDTVRAYREELASYREQLMAPYLIDSKVTRRLVKEAYDRSKFDIDASHILVLVPPNASPADTLKAYQKIQKARRQVLAGTSFETVAKKYSEDPSAKKNGGNLGYFTVFSMVYPFESVAYNTPVHQVSAPFRTNYGYHILKVNDKRPSDGEVEVAHIMIKHNPSDSVAAKVKIGEIYQKLKQNGHFDLMAKQQSDDRNSAINGGVLPKFNRTRMIDEFANVAFSLKEPGELSEPFKTSQGWHIVKLIKKLPIGDFKDERDALERKIEKSERAKIAGKSVLLRLKSTYKIKPNKTLVDAYIKGGTLQAYKSQKEVIATINGKEIPLDSFIRYLESSKEKGALAFDHFMDQEILTYYKENLIHTEPEYAFTLKDYREGLLLFDVMQDKIWGQAERDTIGLKAFYEKHADLYQWGKRAALVIAHCTNLSKAKEVRRLLKQGKSNSEIKKIMNEGATIHVLLSSGVLEEGNKKLPANFTFDKLGVSDVLGKENDFTIIKINEILQPEQMSFQQARGAVVNDYQAYLEASWLKGLRSRYNVSVDNETLNALKQAHGE